VTAFTATATNKVAAYVQTATTTVLTGAITVQTKLRGTGGDIASLTGRLTASAKAMIQKANTGGGTLPPLVGFIKNVQTFLMRRG